MLVGGIAAVERIAVIGRIAVKEGLAVIGGFVVIGGFAVVEIYRNTDNFDRSQLFKFIIFIFRVA
jgi:hypothetical protein